MRVSLMTRRPRRPGNHSVEAIVQGIVDTHSPEFEMSVATSRYFSNGVLPRLYNVVEAATRQGDVNHIVGDVHFLTYLLDPSKTVLTVLDCGRISGESDWRKRVIELLWFQIPTRQCAAITVISQAVKDDLLGYVNIPPEKIHVVPVAVPPVYRFVEREFCAERPVMLQIGTAPNKNLSRLVEALRGIRCKLEIVGRPSPSDLRLLQESSLEYELFESLTNEQVFERYAACDIVTFASTFEGFGMPIIEGNLVGRPVVTGNVTSMPEVAGDAACLVDPLSVESIRAGILRVSEDASYRERLVQAGFVNAKRFEQQEITRQYEAVYRLVAERRVA